MKQRAIIIGAGYGGMALANLLAKRGLEVHVYEKNAAAGGRISAIKQDGFTFDLGPSWYLMPEIFEQYYGLFGSNAATRLDLQRFTPGYQVFYENGTTVRINGDITTDKETIEKIEPGAGKLLEKYVARSTKTYEISVQYFLYNTFQRLRDVIRWPIIASAPKMLPLIFQKLDGFVSKYFTSQTIKQLLEYHMVFLGSSPFQAPAIYSLMSHLDLVSGVFYPKRGMLSLVEDMHSLGDPFGIVYHYDSPVAQILVENNKATGIKLADGTSVKADIVISNADLHFTETALLDAPHQSFPESYWETRQPGPGAFLLSLGVKGSLPSLIHHNLYFVEKWRENFEDIYETKTIPEHASMYICNPTKTDPALAPADHENLFVLMPIPAGITLTAAQEATLTTRIIALLGTLVEDPHFAEKIVTKHQFGPKDFSETFNAWQSNAFGGESHLLNQSVLFRTPNKSKKVKNLYYVGAGTLPGIGLPMCLIGSQLTYKAIFDIKSAGALNTDDF